MSESIAEKFVGIDFTDGETVFDRCAEAIRQVCFRVCVSQYSGMLTTTITQVKKELGELDGILSFCEIAQPLVARLAEKFGLPGRTCQCSTFLYMHCVGHIYHRPSLTSIVDLHR